MTDKEIDKMDKELRLSTMIMREIQQIKETQAMLNKKLEDIELATEQARTEGKKLGIKEVVEWIEEYSRMSYEHGKGEIAFNHVNWHTKLKEWGIEQ